MSAGKLVELCECASRRCGHIYLASEQIWVAERDRTKRGTCPSCGDISYYPLNAAGQRRKDSISGPFGVAALDILPTPRMGPKRRAAVLAAKERAIAMLVAQNTQEKEQ